MLPQPEADSLPVRQSAPMTSRTAAGDAEFTAAERAYLRTQRLARLATVDADGRPQNNPVGFYPRDDGTVVVGGYNLATTRKWRNLKRNPWLALVVDDLASVQPWHVRGVEIRGEAELRTGSHDVNPQMSDELIVVHPRWIHSWGL